MLHPDVSLKLTLATATILTGYALRVTRVVTRENGESLLAVVFGNLLPSLLIQVRERCLEFGYKSYPRARALVETRNRALCSSSSSSSSSRVSAILSFFFARACRFFIGTNKSSHADPSSVFVRVVTCITDVRFARGERGLRGVLRVFRRAVSRGHGIRLFAFSQS